MVLQEFLARIHKFEIRIRKAVNGSMHGNFRSVFKGSGLEFADVREYQYGDDLRLIDWNTTAKGHAIHNRLLDAQRLAEATHIVTPLRQVPVCGITVFAAAVATVVEVDHLRDVGQAGEDRLEQAVVETGTPMQQEYRRPLAHGVAVRHQTEALDIEIEAYAIDADMHG